jgi:hypothetical protein
VGYWDDSRHRFIVLSYNTVIGYSTLSGFGISDEKYSVTTSRHQNLLRRVWGPKATNYEEGRRGPYGAPNQTNETRRIT